MHRRTATALAAATTALTFVALWLDTERRWTDVTVDFGRELYAAWQVAEGAAPYRDLAWLSGPLSVEWNGLLFRAFGTSLSTLVAANTALAAALFALAFGLVARHAGAAAAAVVTATAIAVFAFGQHGGIANYDLVTPYSHEPVHGLALGAAAVLAALRAAGRGGPLAGGAAGVLLALTFLTKAEPFVAAAAGVAAALVTAPSGRRAARWGALVLGAGATAGVAFALLCRALPARAALHALLGPWPYVLGSDVASAGFYARLTGLDDPARSCGRMARWSAARAAALLAPVALLRALPAGARARRATALGAALVTFGAVRLSLARPDTFDVGSPILPAAAAVTLVLAVRLRRGEPRSCERLAWAVFATASLAKLGLRPTFVFYGFVHALPAYVLVATALWVALPRAAARWARVPAGATAAGLGGALCALAALFVSSTWFWRQFKVNEVGAGGDRILADGRGDEVRDALAWIEAHTAPGAPVLVLPEGLTLNYWARRPTPTRFLGFMPTELALFGEAHVVAALEAAPPAAVVLVHKDTSEYGARFFGADYGRALAAWVGERYEPAARFGRAPFVDHRFGVLILLPRRD